MPLFAVLATAAQIGRSIDEPLLQQRQTQRIEFRGNSDVEAAVPVEQGGIASIELQPPFVNQKHGDPGAVFAGVEDLHRFIVLGREALDGGLAKNEGLRGRDVVTKNRAWIVEGGIGVKGGRIVAASAKAARGSRTRQRD